MFKLIVYLELIRLTSKHLHYHVKGPNFYSDHLLTDRIQENIIDYIDSIKENYYMASGEEVPSEYSIINKIKILLPPEPTLEDLQYFITAALEIMNTIKTENKISQISQEVLGDIISNLTNSLGLLNNRLK